MATDRFPVSPHVQQLIAPYLTAMREAKATFDANDKLVATILAAAHVEVLDGWTYDQGWLVSPETQDARTGKNQKDERPSGTALVPAGAGTRPVPGGPRLMPPGKGDKPEGQ